MIRMTKKTNNSKNSIFKKLSIQFSLDGFSFCILDNLQKITHFSEVIFNTKLATPQELLFKIETTFKKEEVLQQDFSTVLAIHQNKLSTIVPTIFFDKNELKSYLNFNAKTLKTDLFSFDNLNNIDAKNVYIPYININNYLFQHFGEFEYKHYTSILIDKLIAKNQSSAKKMFVYVSKNTLNIVVLENKQLLLANTFSFHTKEDFIYYILFVAKQLKLDTEKFVLSFLGDIEKDSEIYKITYNYVRYINFYESKNSFLNKKQFTKHPHFILIE